MQQFGVAVAVVGQEPQKAKFVCNTLTMSSGDISTRQILPEYSFQHEIDLTSPAVVRAEFNHLTKVAAGVIALQMVAADDAGAECPQVPVVVGKESRVGYDLEAVWDAIYPNLEALPQPGTEEFIDLTRLAVVLKYALLETGNFTRSQTVENADLEAFKAKLLAGEDEFCNELKSLIAAFKQEQEQGIFGDAYYTLLELCEIRGVTLAQTYNSAYDRMTVPHLTASLYFCRETPLWPDFHKRQDLQDAAPHHVLPSLHPDFLDTMRREYIAHQGIEQEVYLKPPTEESSPFFVDVVTARLVRQHKVSTGFIRPDEKFEKAHLREWFEEDDAGALTWRAQLFNQYSYVPFDDFRGELLRRVARFGAFGELSGAEDSQFD
jgi:hypothetical protein